MTRTVRLLNRSCPGPHAEAALKHLSLAIEETRAVAQGLSPPVLTDAGLQAALQSLSETRDLRLSADRLRRLDPAAEATAYQLVEAATREAPSIVGLDTQGQTLRMRLTVPGDPAELTTTADRVITLGGQMVVRHEGGTTRIAVDLPIEMPPEQPSGSGVAEVADKSGETAPGS